MGLLPPLEALGFRTGDLLLPEIEPVADLAQVSPFDIASPQ